MPVLQLGKLAGSLIGQITHGIWGNPTWGKPQKVSIVTQLQIIQLTL